MILKGHRLRRIQRKLQTYHLMGFVSASQAALASEGVDAVVVADAASDDGAVLVRDIASNRVTMAENEGRACGSYARRAAVSNARCSVGAHVLDATFHQSTSPMPTTCRIVTSASTHTTHLGHACRIDRWPPMLDRRLEYYVERVGGVGLVVFVVVVVVFPFLRGLSHTLNHNRTTQRT
jgi:hypothetical protein